MGQKRLLFFFNCAQRFSGKEEENIYNFVINLRSVLCMLQNVFFPKSNKLESGPLDGFFVETL